MRPIAVAFSAFLIVIHVLVMVSCQTCPTYDVDLPPRPPSQVNFDAEMRQNFGTGTRAFTLMLKNVPVYKKAGLFILTKPLDTYKLLTSQVTNNNVDGITTCSLSTTDRSVVCSDYSRQFSNSNYRTTVNGCFITIEIDLTFDQYKSIATFNSVKGIYELGVNIGYYTKSNIDGEIYWTQSNLVTFSVTYQKVGDLTDSPYQLTTGMNARALNILGKNYASYTMNLQASMNDTLFIEGWTLKTQDMGVMKDYSGRYEWTETCYKKTNSLSNTICDGYIYMRSDMLTMSLSNSGTYCALNTQKSDCKTRFPFVATPQEAQVVAKSPSTEVSAASYPTLYLAVSNDENRKKSISTEGDTYIVIPLNVARASFRASNVQVVLKAKGAVKDLTGRIEIYEDPTTSMVPAVYADKVCIVLKLIEKYDRFFVNMERPTQLKVTWDLLPRVAARAGAAAVDIDSQFSTALMPEMIETKSSACRLGLGFVVVALAVLSFFL